MFDLKKDPIIECVPNFSEGQNEKSIFAIANAIKQVKGVKLLHIDSGIDANRTVMTFVGTPEAVIEAAFQAIKVASELIDMQIQKGAHPRFGATDVCPLIPLRNISMEKVIEYSKILAKRVGDELQIPVYLYEHSASSYERKNLAYLRKGNYEAIAQKINEAAWKPDFGPQKLNAKSGNIAIGARNFLIAYNINLKSKNVEIAKAIAAEVRTSGNSNNKCAALKAIGWFMPSYDCAQVSMNIIDFRKTGIHQAFEAVKESAEKRNVQLDGSEIIGLVPKDAMVEAGAFYSGKKNIKCNTDLDRIQLAMETLGLSRLKNFDPNTRIIEYLL